MKETKIEKLILDLSTRWEVSPEEAVDRLNSMNESEINKLINSMTKKFQNGGLAGRQEAILPNNEYYSVVPQGNEVYEKLSAPGKVLYRRIRTRFPKNGGVPVLDTLITRGNVNTNDYITNTLDMTSPYKKTGSLVDKEVWKQLNDAMDSRRRAALSFKNGGMIDCLRNGGSVEKCKCGCGKITKHQETSIIGKQVDGMGLPVQLPNKTKDLKYSNIISDGVTGKAATWIPKDGKSQVTEFLMADNNPDVPGYANDIKMEIYRDPRTGALGDTLLRSKILPGIYGIGFPIKYRSDASVVRNAKKRK